MLSPALCVVRPGCSGLAGKSLGAVLGGEPPLPCSPRLYALFGPSAPALPEGARVKSWLSAAGQRKAPLVQRGDSMATPCRGDCEAGGMIQLVFYCRVREHRLGAAARRQSLSRRSPTAPFAQGSRLCLSASGLPTAQQKAPPLGELFLHLACFCCPARERNMTAQALGPGDGLSHPEH